MSRATFNNGDPRMNKNITKSPFIPSTLSSSSSSSLLSATTPITNENKKNINIIGFPSDVGTVRNGGRAGGAAGPDAFRRFLMSKGPIDNPEIELSLSQINIIDRGNVIDEQLSGLNNTSNEHIFSDKLENALNILRQVVHDSLQTNSFPFCIGGSNDQSYANACGLIDMYGAKNVSVVNIDAHLDVRPLVPNPLVTTDDQQNSFVLHSGSPFRLLLEHDEFIGSNFEEFAVQGMQCSKEHAQYVLDKGGRITWLQSIMNGTGVGVGVGVGMNMNDNTTTTNYPTTIASKMFVETLQRLSNNNQHIFVSFDIDAVRGSDAPGVSCPSPIGLSSDDAIAMAFEAGRHPNVSLFDLSELCPGVEEYRTPMLAAFMFYYFSLGYSLRK